MDSRKEGKRMARVTRIFRALGAVDVSSCWKADMGDLRFADVVVRVFG